MFQFEYKLLKEKNTDNIFHDARCSSQGMKGIGVIMQTMC